MPYVLIILCLLLGASVLMNIFFFLQKRGFSRTNTHLQKENQDLKDQSIKLSSKVEYLEKSIEDQKNERKNIEEKYQTQLDTIKQEQEKNLQTLGKKLEDQFKDFYSTQNTLFLTQNRENLNKESTEILDKIFSPIKEQITGYQESLIKNQTQMQTEIKHLFQYSQDVKNNANKISEDAANLAKVLKGDKKIRGDFGELQLKNVLDQSGLIEGEHYTLQVPKEFDGIDYRPDAIINLDKNKKIIIDSKFSLPSNLDFSEINEQVCSEIAQNLRARIQELSKKPYTKLESCTYEYVLLFVPYQNILDLALSVQSDIYKYAYTKNIFLTTPHTLFMGLKTISITWLETKRQENIQEALKKIGSFYDKFALVLESFEDMEKNITKLNESYEKMGTRLCRGRDNLNKQFESLCEYGITKPDKIERLEGKKFLSSSLPMEISA